MASNNKLMESIEANVSSIRESKFGTKLKLPTSANEEKENTKQELAYEQMIMGSLASLIWGVKTITKDTQVKTLLGNGNTIFNIVRNIWELETKSFTQIKKCIGITNKELINIKSIFTKNLDDLNDLSSTIADLVISINSYADNISNILEHLNTIDNYILNSIDNNTKNSINKTSDDNKNIEAIINKNSINDIVKAINESVEQKINIEFSGNGITDLSQLIDQLNNEKLSDKFDIPFNNINALIDALHKLEDITTYNPEKVLHGIQELNKIFNPDKHGNKINDKTNLPKLFENIADTVNFEKEINKDISKLSSVINTIITIISIDPKSINLNGLNTLLRISDPAQGDIKRLINQLSIITTGDNAANINNDALLCIESFFEAMSSIGDIGMIKRSKIKSNIRYFNNFIGEEIPKLINEIAKESKKIENDKENSICALANIFIALSKIGELDFKHKIRMKLNLMFIRNFIINDVIELLNDIADAINKYTPEAFKSLEELNKLFDKLFEISNIGIRKFLKLSINLSILEAIIDEQLIGDKENNSGILTSISNIDKTIIDDASQNIQKINELFNSIGNIISDDKLSLENVILFAFKLNFFASSKKIFIKFLDTVNIIVGKLKEMPKLTDKQKENINLIIGTINELFNINGTNPIKITLLYFSLLITSQNVNIIKSIIQTLNRINIKDKDKIGNIIKIIQDLLILKGGIARAKVLNKTLQSILDSTEIIKDICKKLKDIDNEYDIEKTKAIIDSFNNILLKSAAILIIGGIVMRIINPVKLILFALTLGAFLWGITQVYKNIAETLNESIGVSKDAINLIIISGAILIIGGLVMNFINPVKLILFAVTLGVFILMVAGAYWIISKSGQEIFKSAKQFSMLLIVSASILIFGALFMKTGLAEQSIYFAIMLTVFISLITLVYKKASKDIQKSLGIASELAILIAVSAGVLMLGSLFMSNLKRVLGTLAFAFILGVFIWGIISILKFAGRHIKSSITTMIAISILITVAAATLLIGGALFAIFPNLMQDVLKFGIILIGFILTISLICILLNIVKKWVKPGILILLGIITVIGLAAIAVALVSLVSLLVSAVGYDKIFMTLGIMAAVIIGMGVICGIIGIPIVAACVALGIVVVAMAVVLFLLMSVALAAFVAVVKYASTLDPKTVDNAFNSIGSALWGLIKLTPHFIGLAAALPFMLPGIAAVLTLSATLSILAFTIKQWANLKIPIYEGKKIVGYKTIDNSDFVKAGDNIKSVITTLFDAIKEVYAKDTTGAFNLDATTILTGKLPIARVINSTMQLGKMLSNIAHGIKEWAKLRIPEYGANGKLIGYKTIDNSDFVTAGNNIKSVLIALGQAVINVYNENQKMFETNEWLGFGDTPFAKVTKSMKTMGPMLSSIAHGVKTWAELKIPIYKGTKVIGYKELKGNDIKKAQQTITEVTKALAQGIIDVYDQNANTGMFDDKSWHGFGDTPFAKVTKSMKTMGPMLSSIAHGVQTWADLKIPVYGDPKDGTKITSYTRLEGEALRNAQKTITDVTKALAQGIIDVYDQNANTGMFDDDSWHGFGDNKFAKVTKSMKTMGSALKNIADAVQMWAELKIPVYGDPKDGTKITSYQTIDNNVFKKVASHIQYVVTQLAFGIAEIAKNPTYKDLFINDDFWGGDSDVVKVLKSIQPMGSALKDIADAIIAWSTMNIPVYGDPKDKTKITSYTPLTLPQITAAQQNIVSVVEALLVGIGQVYNKEVDGFKYKELFDNTGVFGQGDSPIEKVLNVMQPVGTALKNIADAIKAWADLRIPIYGNKNSIEPTGYLSIGGDDGINTAQDNIKKVLKTIICAIASVYYGKIVVNGKTHEYKELFNNGKDNILTNISKNISNAANMLKNVAGGITSIANLKIPVYNSKGKIIAYHNIENGDFTKIGSVIYNVLTAIGNAMVEVATKPELDVNKNPNFALAVESIKASTDILGSIASVVGNFAEGKFILYTVSKNKLIPSKVIDINADKTKQSIQKNITAVLNIIKDAVNQLANDATFQVNDETNKQILNAKTAIVTLINNIGEIYQKIGDTNKIFDSNKQSIEDFVTKSSESDSTYKYVISVNLEKIINCINEVTQILNSNLLSIQLKEFNNKEENLINGITSTYNIIYKFLVILSKLANENKKVKGAQFNNISEIIEKFSKELSNINSAVYSSNNLNKRKINNVIEDSNNILTILTNLIEILKISKELGKESFDMLGNGITSLYSVISKIGNDNNLNFIAFTSLINTFILTISSIDANSFYEKIEVLKDGIIGIYKSIESSSNNNAFKSYNENLKNYVEIINSIQLNKINSLTNFIYAMNELSQRLGNLDNLTDAIGNKLSQVLYELVLQLRKAEATINNAHELQEKRKKLMEESMTKIERIMNQHMIVEISQQKDDEEIKSPGSINDIPVTDDKPQGTDTQSSSTSAPQLSNPENAIAANGTKDNKITKLPDYDILKNTLTFTDFKRYMENEFINKIKE